LTNNKIDLPSATLWLLDGSRVHEDDAAFFVQQLGVSEAHRYVCFKRRERQRQFLLARMLLRLVVSSLTALPPAAIGVVEQDGDGPELVLPDSQSFQPGFSLSHSGNWVACVLSSSVTLGVDIEVNDATRDVTPISHLAFHPEEHVWLLSQPDAARASAFYQLWCAREALYKLMSNLGRETVLSPLIGANGALATQGPGWHRYNLTHSALIVAVCSDRPLSALSKVELPRLTRADWLALGREFLQAHDDANERAVR
jgi:4'-phosphopantetheinyl transferase